LKDAIADIETFTAEVDFEAFRQNREKVLAVVKAIEIRERQSRKFLRIPATATRRFPRRRYGRAETATQIDGSRSVSRYSLTWLTP
jgi:hypothetical protein